MLSEPDTPSEASHRLERCRTAYVELRRERDELVRLTATMRDVFRLIGEALMEAEMVIDEMSCYGSEAPEDIAWRLREHIIDAILLAAPHEKEGRK